MGNRHLWVKAGILPIGGHHSSPGPLLEFIGQVHYLYTQQRNLMKPVIVHCSCGVDRSGVFCVVYTAVQEMIQGRGIISVKDTVKRLRQRRKYMVEEKEQYLYCYSAVLASAQDLLMKYGRLPKKPPGDKTGDKSNTVRADDTVLSELNTFQDIQSSVAKLSVKHTVSDDVIMGDGMVDNVSVPNQDLTKTSSENDVTKSGNDIIMSGSPTPVSSHSKVTVGSDKRCDSPGRSSQRSSRSSSPMIFTNLPPKLADLQDPSRFSLDQDEIKKNKVTKSNFVSRVGSLHSASEDPADPLSSLDPMWTAKNT